jgi:hypothetical protein
VRHERKSKGEKIGNNIIGRKIYEGKICYYCYQRQPGE